MRIGIDVRYLSHGLIGGVHTYVAGFVAALLHIKGEHSLFLYADTKRPLELDHLPAHATVRYLPYRSPLSSVVNDLLMRRAVARDQIDVMHYPANYGFSPPGTRTVITLHDEMNILPLPQILHCHRKHPRIVAMMTYLHLLTRAAVRRADLLLTDSEYSRQAIIRHSNFEPERIHVAYLGLGPDVARVEDPDVLRAVRDRYDLRRPIILADALKNPRALIRAWHRLPEALRQAYEIVFFSRRPDVLPVVREAVANGDAKLFVKIPTSDLVAFYSMAQAFVFPSPIEGFGLPLIEAMSCGAPVIASDRGSVPEIVGDAALIAGADDAAMIARHLSDVLSRPELARELRARGYARALDFTWPQTARKILDTYQLALQLSPRAIPGAMRFRQT